LSYLAEQENPDFSCYYTQLARFVKPFRFDKPHSGLLHHPDHNIPSPHPPLHRHSDQVHRLILAGALAQSHAAMRLAEKPGEVISGLFALLRRFWQREQIELHLSIRHLCRLFLRRLDDLLYGQPA